MGYDVHHFFDDKCICVICTMVLECPMQSVKCEHTFCRDCIMQWLAINKTCPLDRSPMEINDLRALSDLECRMLDQLEIKCVYESDGCSEPIKLYRLKHHIETCKYNPNLLATCDKGCGLRMTYKDYDKTNCFTHLANLVSVQQKQIEIRTTDPTVLRHAIGKQLSFAQSIQSLDRDNSYFKVKVLESGDSGKISIGLTDHKYSTDKHPGYARNSIAYHGHDGMLYVSSEIGNGFGPTWQKDDVIECGVKFGPENDLVYETVIVYFTKNNQFIGERRITMFYGDMFPSIGMQSSGAIVQLMD